MKNHWLEVHRRKQGTYWTVEFAHKGVFKLQPRQVKVENPQYTLGYLGQNSGNVTLIFANGMLNTGDHELLDFLSDVTANGFGGAYSRLRKYQGLMSRNELENFELTRLTGPDFGIAVNPNDLKFKFDFAGLKHHKN